MTSDAHSHMFTYLLQQNICSMLICARPPIYNINHIFACVCVCWCPCSPCSHETPTALRGGPHGLAVHQHGVWHLAVQYVLHS